MARVRKRRRGKSGNSDWKWIAAIIACVGISAGVGYFAFVQAGKSAIDVATLCHRTGPVKSVAVLLDLTDPLNTTQAARLRRQIDQMIDRAKTDTMVSIGVVSEDPANWGVRFSRCKPATGDDANILYENPGLIAATYESEFTQPLDQLLDRLMSGDVENRSPIMEALQALVAEAPSFPMPSGESQILIVSDMLQHSDVLSFYRGEGWSHFTEPNEVSRLAQNLSGVDVQLMIIPRTGGNIPGRADVEDFWSRYLDVQGANIPTLSQLGDL